ncbi:hypothetical protein PRtIB026_A23390 [Pseudomonas sp. RtIB026]|uniref:alpha/beta hydrolase n=1 Tax=Pseudomonas sp. RtIB026 TaxID=2749999 RepID=UPI00194191F9|nr:alpha/beta hydrolase [Pseudomonas sp. RtIB026]BCJ07972.1 hypothetical protein PRtIB026_A23390 [Pseudomonas sp. RtIB026]
MTKLDGSPSIADMMAMLELAVRANDHERARELEQEILLRLSCDNSEFAHIEQRVQALLAELRQPRKGAEALSLDDLTLERTSTQPGILYPVWFGTNRKPQDNGFSNERHHLVTYGKASVFVPEAHRFGETGSNFWRRLWRFDLRDDNLHLKAIELRDEAAFFAQVLTETQTAEDEGGTPHALVFLHGYNVTFEEAAIRAAQLGVDLSVEGTTAFFSWPSRGNVLGYPVDEASIEASEPAITEFLVNFATRCGAQKVHVIAHSMGNRGLLRALQRIAANAETRGKVRFGQIFLAAPDIDRDLFLDLSSLYSTHADRVTLYASDADNAVYLSTRVHDSPRAGYFPPYTVVAGIDTVKVPNFNVDFLGHSYFAQAQALLHDIYDLMRHDSPPQTRQRIAPTEFEGQQFWRLKR